MTSRRTLRVMVAGGGTGGHVFPGIAVYNALKRSHEDIDVVFVGAKAGVESKIFAELGLPSVLLPGRGVRGASIWSKLTSPVPFLLGLARSVKEIVSFKPDVVIGTGGFASVAMVAASVLCRRRRVLQEQNSIPGMTNRLLSRFADLVLLAYEESRAFFGREVRCEVVGNPLRVQTTVDRFGGCRFLGLDENLPTVLVFGGSRGARAINDAATAAIQRILSQRSVQFVVVAGHGDYERVTHALRDHSRLVKVLPFLNEIHHAYSAATIAVSRAGASSVFELCAFGVPTVFIPYPYAADDHQAHNVARLHEMGAVEVIENRRLDGASLQAIILSLLDDAGRRGTMATRMKSWVRTDADREAARLILDLVANKTSLAAVSPGPDGRWVDGFSR